LADAFLHGTVHEAQEDLRAAVQSPSSVLALWQALTPLGRNEFICWVDDAKQAATRERRIARNLARGRRSAVRQSSRLLLDVVSRSVRR
jgi:hypothetical protein